MTLATPRTEINNEIVSLRQYVRQARICIINKLIREAKRLRTKRGNEKQVEKNKSKADKYLREVFALKRIKDDEISKFGILNLEHLQDVLQNLNTDDESRAMTKVARYKSLKEKLIEFKHKFPSYREHVSLKKKKPSVRKKRKNIADEIRDGNDKRVEKNTNKVRQANVTSIDHSRCITLEQNIEIDGKCDESSEEMLAHEPKKNKSEKQVNRNTTTTKRNHQGSKFAIKVISNEAAVKRFAQLLQETNAQGTNDSCEANNKQETSDESLEIRENTDDFFLHSNEIVSCTKVETFSQDEYTNVGDNTFKALHVRNETDKFHRNKVNKDRRNIKVRKIDNEDTCNDRNSITEGAGIVPRKQNKMVTSVKKTSVAQRNMKIAKSLENENLHPSWAARKKQQQVMKQGFQGKKIRFDDN